ncbi:MAG: CinA family protein [Synergistaceae bacterium]|jgi:nicotinamide-nucleotide amidase|nr:CinA family protein [Synergistaceae bacterium]
MSATLPVIDEYLREAARLWRELASMSGENYLFTFAESCTGGMLASFVTSVAGVSSVFPGSLVTYGNEAKRDLLAVSGDTLERFGAVSAECAVEMARGALERFGTLVAVSVTGVAGPGGGSTEKPVGTVWFAAAHRDGATRLRRGFYPGRGRRQTRERAVVSALGMLIVALRREAAKTIDF